MLSIAGKQTLNYNSGNQFLFCFLLNHFIRSSKKDAAKEAARQEELSNILYQIQELCFRVEQQDAQIREMHRNVVELGM